MKKSKKLVPLLIPMLVVWGVITVFPVLASFFKSFQSCRGTSCEFVGVNNYVSLLSDPMFKASLINTGIFFVIQVPIMILLAIILANILNSKKLKFRGIYRSLIILPAVTSLVVYTIFFKLLFIQNGMVNNLLMSLHIIDQPINWLMDGGWTRVILIIALIWRWTGYNMIFFLAGMQNIDDEIYEAARIDGASAIDRFRHITLPLLKPIILFVTVVSTLGTLNLFDEPKILANGGPGDATMTLAQMVYKHLFFFTPNAGYASAIAYVIVIIAVIFAIVQNILLKDKEDK